MNELTLGCLKGAYEKNGTSIVNVNGQDDLLKIQRYALGKEKNSLPCLTAYRGSRGEYGESNVFFIDIDSTEGVDIVIENRDELFKYASFIYFIQKSYSGKLHICGVFPLTIEKDEFEDYASRYTMYVIYLIKKLFDVDYYDIGAIDQHSFGIHQLLYMSGNIIYFNPLLCTQSIKDSDYNQLKKIYPKLNVKDKKHFINVLSQVSLPDIEVEINSNVNQSKIVKEIYEHTDRWIMVQALKSINNDFDWVLNISKLIMVQQHGKGKSVGDSEWRQMILNNFNDPKLPHEYAIRSRIKKLEEMGIVKTNVKINDETPESAVRILKKGEYLSKDLNDIVNFIHRHKRCSLVAPTGSGKTALINGFNDKDGLAKKLNAVVLVPYNSGNHLYNNLYEVSTGKGNQKKDIPVGQPVTMVLDQALNHIDELTGRQLLIDESHILYTDRVYRDRVVDLLDALIKSDIKICCISATPEGEIDKLGCRDNMLVYKRERSIVNVEEIYTDNVDLTLKDYANCKYYDKVVTFSDRYAKKCYENLIQTNGSYNIAYIRSEMQETDDFKRVKENELIDKKITICTRVAFNGLNFKNVNERILVLTTFKTEENLPSEVIQCIGRFRDCPIDVKIIIDERERDLESIEDRLKRARFYSETFSDDISRAYHTNYSRELLDDRKYDTLKEIESYIKEHSTVSELNEKLIGLGYVNLKEKSVEVKDKDGKVIQARMSLKLKRAISDKFYEDMKNCELREVIDQIDDYGDVYYNELLKRWKKLKSGVVTEAFIISYKDGCKRDKLMDTIFNEVDDIVDVCYIPQVVWDKWIEMSGLYLELAKKSLNQIELKNYISREKKLKEIRNKYYDQICVDGNFNCVIQDVECDAFNRLMANSRGGKKGKGKTRNSKKLKYNGMIYNSRKELAESIGKNVDTITNWIKKGKVLEIK